MNTSPFRKYGKLSNALALLSLCFMLSVGINAQHKLNAQELKLFKQSAKNKIAELQNCISTVVDKKLDDYTRDKSIQSAVKLFIEGAKMQVSTLLPQGNTEFNNYDIEEYFFRLKRLKYKSATIEFYDLFFMNEFTPGKDGRYYATATIFQKFKGVTDDGILYEDETTKQITIVLEYAEDEFFKTNRWLIRLGDIKVQDTKL